MLKIGDVVSARSLTKLYGDYFFQICRELVAAEPTKYSDAAPGKRKRRLPTVYKIVSELPTVETYRELLRKKYTTNVANLVSEVQSEIEDLTSELQEWFDNLPESFQSGSKGDALNDAICSLESIQLPDVPEGAEDIEVYYLPSLDTNSRPKRAMEAASKLIAAKEAVDEKVIELREENKPDESGDAPAVGETNEPDGDDSDLADSLEGFSTELENAASEFESIEFPGMFT